jgi:ferric iron reductase protein FhuF
VAPDALVRVYPDEAALLDAVAAAAVATLAPLLDEVRAATRFGLVPLWNAAGDAVRLTAAMVPRYAGRTPRPGLATALLDALVAHGAPIRGRGTDQPLPGRAERVPVRAACCLAYRTDPPVADPSDALCTTCPLLDPPERARRYAAWLMRVAQAGR